MRLTSDTRLCIGKIWLYKVWVRRKSVYRDIAVGTSGVPKPM